MDSQEPKAAGVSPPSGGKRSRRETHKVVNKPKLRTTRAVPTLPDVCPEAVRCAAAAEMIPAVCLGSRGWLWLSLEAIDQSAASKLQGSFSAKKMGSRVGSRSGDKMEG